MAEFVDAEELISITLTPTSTCPVPIVTYVRFPEIWFEGTTAFCEVKIDVGSGNSINSALSTIEMYDGMGWVTQGMSQVNTGLSTQTVILEWQMRADTERAVCHCWIASSCGTTTPSFVNTDYYKYPVVAPPVPCPEPTAAFIGSPRIAFMGTQARCDVTFSIGDGHTIDLANSAFTCYNGSRVVDLKHLIGTSSKQTIPITWDMVQSTSQCYVNLLIRNDCGSFVTANTGYYTYTEAVTPPPPPTTEGDPTTVPYQHSLEAGEYNITITKNNYETVTAKITVSSSGVVSCTDAVCLASGYPHIEASNSSVRVWMKAGVSTGGKCGWVNAQDHSKTFWISELIKAYFERADLGFVVEGHSAYISSAIKVYFGRGTISTEFGC